MKLSTGSALGKYNSGVVRVISGEASYGSSGEVAIESSAGFNSGPVRISSGTGRSDKSGDVEVKSGQGSKGTGTINLATSSTDYGGSGDVSLSSGDSTHNSGNVTLAAGRGHAYSGHISLTTAKSISRYVYSWVVFGPCDIL